MQDITVSPKIYDEIKEIEKEKGVTIITGGIGGYKRPKVCISPLLLSEERRILKPQVRNRCITGDVTTYKPIDVQSLGRARGKVASWRLESTFASFLVSVKSYFDILNILI